MFMVASSCVYVSPFYQNTLSRNIENFFGGLGLIVDDDDDDDNDEQDDDNDPELSPPDGWHSPDARLGEYRHKEF